MGNREKMMNLPYIYEENPQDTVYPHDMAPFADKIMLFDADAWDEQDNPCGCSGHMEEYNNFWRSHLPNLRGKVPLIFSFDEMTDPDWSPYSSVVVHNDGGGYLYSLSCTCEFVFEYRGIKMEEVDPEMFTELSEYCTIWSYPMCFLSRDSLPDDWDKRPAAKPRRSNF